MEPRPITDEDLASWSEYDPTGVVLTAPGEREEGIEPCPAIHLQATHEVAVPWTFDEIELTHLAKGGTLWLIARGGMPIHGMLVKPKESA